VPDVVGRKLSAAEAILTNADLLYAVTVTFDASCSDEPIVISEPAEGTVVPEGTTIQLIVNAACDDRTSYLDA
jgi:beta-lactam-binding protein with PASTA domain